MKENKSLVKRIMAALAAGTILIAVPMSGCNSNNNNEKKDSSGESAVSGDTSDSNSNSTIVATSEHYSIPFSVFQYLYNYNYKSFVSNYGTQLIDSSKPLNEQYYDQDNKISWHDYFITSTEDYITYIVCFAEGGLAHGMQLTADEKKEIEDGFKEFESAAAQNSKSVDEYIKEVYGDDVTKDDIINIQTMSKIGLKYRNELYKSYKLTDADYEKKYNEDKTSYQIADYYSYTFSYTETNEDGTSQTVNEETKKKMEENAKALSNSKSGKEFNDYLTKYLKANPSLVPVNSTSSESSLTEEEFNNLLNSYVESCYHAKSAYDDSNDLSKWVFDESRKANETKVEDTGSGYTVVLVDKPLYRNETGTRNVRHILITSDSITNEDGSEVTDAQVKAEAERILKEWNSKDSTEERFAELAKQYSMDPGSKANGGIYENVEPGQMVPAFNDWLFDKNRKPGDTGIVKTDYGYHIMFYIGEGLKSWQVKIDSALRDEKLAADYEGLKKDYPIEFDKEAVDKAEIKKEEESSDSSAANLAQQ